MRVQVNDKRLLRDLLRYLRECGCVAEQASENELDVFLPDTPNERAARMELSAYLTAWRVRNPGGEAEMIG